jgi:hypothetical protein
MTKNTDNNICNLKQLEIIEIAYKKSLNPTIIFTKLHYHIIVSKLSHKKFIQGIKRTNMQEFL